MFTETVSELPGFPVQNCQSRSFLFWGGAVDKGGIVNNIVWMGCPRRTPWTMLRTPVCIRILSTSFSSVSIFSVCCYSRYLSRWVASCLLVVALVTSGGGGGRILSALADGGGASSISLTIDSVELFFVKETMRVTEWLQEIKTTDKWHEEQHCNCNRVRMIN